MKTQRVAIVGAGISGATCAGMLAAAGCDVDVFDKARGAGGRLATRRLDSGWVTLGAPFVSAWNPPFRAQLATWSSRGWLLPLAGRMLQGRADKGWVSADLQHHYLPLIETSRLVRDLLGSAKLQTLSKVAAIRPHTLVFEDGRVLGDYDRVVCSVPSPQAVGLLQAFPALRERLGAVRYRPLWSFLLHWTGGPTANVLKFDDPQLDLAVQQSAAGPGQWVVHSSHEFAEAHADAAAVTVSAHAVAVLMGLLGLEDIEVIDAQHWRYARAVEPVGGYWLTDEPSGVALIGDGITGAGIERAWESGMRLAQLILEPGR